LNSVICEGLSTQNSAKDKLMNTCLVVKNAIIGNFLNLLVALYDLDGVACD